MSDTSKPDLSAIVAIVDDDEAIRTALGRLIRTLGFHAVQFASGENLLEALETVKPTCVLTDIQMPGMTGFELASELRQIRSDLPIAVMTAYPSLASQGLASTATTIEYLAKPIDLDRLERWLAEVPHDRLG